MLYLATSALLKLYILEPESADVHKAIIAGQDEPMPEKEPVVCGGVG